jgi:hypothetical protein
MSTSNNKQHYDINEYFSKIADKNIMTLFVNQ